MPGAIDAAEGRALIGLDPQNYDAVRPQYPEQVFEFLLAKDALRPDAVTLEIGAGTGLATRRLLEFGVNSLTLIEPDVRFSPWLTPLAKQFGADIRIVTESFEEAALPSRHFDLVAAATSFHWVQPSLGFQKIADVLKPGGYAALWWHAFGDSVREDPFHEATREILCPLANSLGDVPGGVPFALDTQARLLDFSRTGQFERPESSTHSWTLVLDTAQVGALYATFSAINRLPEPQRSRILQQLMDVADRQFGGRVERKMVSPVYVARRKSNIS